jgi:hypothetical protein
VYPNRHGAAGRGTRWGDAEGGDANAVSAGGREEMVEVSGLEPLTFWLPARRSPN